jgi:serine/threonine-protein kinase
MAEVYLAVMTSGNFSKLVVIKKLREHLAKDTEFVSMLMDEGRIAGLLNHPNLVQTIEVGETNGEFFLAMEYLDGQPLHRIVRRGVGGFPLLMHMSILAEVLVGMEYAHELKDLDGTPLNIVHRDVTPHNVFVTYQGVTKVVDFGIAKAVGRASETRHGVIKGKAAYMAPEHALGAQIDRRADIFAIGVMLYEAAAARRMWQGVSEVDAIRNLVSGQIPQSPKKINPAVDDELDRICQRALTYAPADRYQTAREMERDLRAFLATKGPVPSAQEIGGYVAKLFAEKRDAIQKIIEEQLAQVRSSRAASLPRVAQTDTRESLRGPASGGSVTGSRSSSRSNSTSSALVSASEPAPNETVLDEPPTELLDGPRPRRRRDLSMLWMIAVALVVLAGTLAITLFAFPKRPIDKQPPVTAPPTSPISVTLRATPLETRFSIDDGPSLENPYIGMFPRDSRPHVIRAVAPGYPAKTETVAFTEDVSVRFTLSMSARQGN